MTSSVLVDAAPAAAKTSVILEARDLAKSYPLASGSVEALRGVTLTVQRGEFVAIMGQSGSGKSTMLHLLGGLDRPTEGEVVIDGVNISRLSERRATLTRREKTGFVFQFFNLIPLLTVAENVALPFMIRGESVAKHRDDIDRVITEVGLKGKEEHRPDQLSAGEQQRVALARARAPRPSVVLLDEPFSSLDETLRAQVRADTIGMIRATGATAVLVTHDQTEALSCGDRVVVMHDGRIEQADTAVTVF